MKKIVSFLLLACFCVSMTACQNQQPSNGNTEGNGKRTNEENQSETAEPAETAEPTETTETSTGQTQTETGTLVVYFSSTGNTKAVAEHIAKGLDADLYEIVPEVPYTDADLDYGDDNSRSTIEMNDSSVRPVIVGSVENMEQYGTIYIGYPIWWGEAPRIVDTFVESYDFTDKTVIPFCTSASSGMGSSAKRLEELAGSGTWLEGQRFSGSEDSEEIMEWVNGL